MSNLSALKLEDYNIPWYSCSSSILVCKPISISCGLPSRYMLSNNFLWQFMHHQNLTMHFMLSWMWYYLTWLSVNAKAVLPVIPFQVLYLSGKVPPNIPFLVELTFVVGHPSVKCAVKTPTPEMAPLFFEAIESLLNWGKCGSQNHFSDN